MPTQIRPLGVFNEWGRLKEVLVGDSSRCVFPHLSPDWGRYYGFEEMLRGLGGVSLRQAMPERAKGVTEQTEGLVRVLEDRGVTVHRPRPLTDAEIAASPVGLFNQYARDPQIVIGRHIIETNLRMMFRCKEHLGYDQLFCSRLTEDPDARHVRMPDTTPILSGETEGEFLNDPRPFLEGGDTFVLGKDILIGVFVLSLQPRRCGLAAAVPGTGRLSGPPRAADDRVAPPGLHVRRPPRGTVHVLYARTEGRPAAETHQRLGDHRSERRRGPCAGVQHNLPRTGCRHHRRGAQTAYHGNRKARSAGRPRTVRQALGARRWHPLLNTPAASRGLRAPARPALRTHLVESLRPGTGGNPDTNPERSCSGMSADTRLKLGIALLIV